LLGVENPRICQKSFGNYAINRYCLSYMIFLHEKQRKREKN